MAIFALYVTRFQIATEEHAPLSILDGAYTADKTRLRRWLDKTLITMSAPVPAWRQNETIFSLAILGRRPIRPRVFVRGCGYRIRRQEAA